MEERRNMATKFYWMLLIVVALLLAAFVGVFARFGIDGLNTATSVVTSLGTLLLGVGAIMGVNAWVTQERAKFQAIRAAEIYSAIQETTTKLNQYIEEHFDNNPLAEDVVYARIELTHLYNELSETISHKAKPLAKMLGDNVLDMLNNLQIEIIQALRQDDPRQYRKEHFAKVHMEIDSLLAELGEIATLNK